MVLANPRYEITTKALGECDHVGSFCIGDGVSSLIVRDISLLSKGIELLDGRGVRAEGARRESMTR
jgi:hypothetical protein